MKKTTKRISSILIIISSVASLVPYRAVSAAEIAQITLSPFVGDTPTPEETPSAVPESTPEEDMPLLSASAFYETDTLPAIDMTPDEGNLLVGVSGSYYTETADKILKRLNQIRYEACSEGLIDPYTNQALTVEDYVPLKWSSDLEVIGRLQRYLPPRDNRRRQMMGRHLFLKSKGKGTIQAPLRHLLPSHPVNWTAAIFPLS